MDKQDWHPADIIAALKKTRHDNGGAFPGVRVGFFNVGEYIVASLAERRKIDCGSTGS